MINTDYVKKQLEQDNSHFAQMIRAAMARNQRGVAKTKSTGATQK